MFSVHQHWDPLKVCALGRSYPPEFYSYIKDARVRNVFEKIAIETEEDYQKIISKLEEFDVEVLRTDIKTDDLQLYLDEGGKSLPAPPMTPRDFTAMVGNRFFMPSERYADDVNPRGFLAQLTNEMSLKEMCNTLDTFPDIKTYLFDVLLPGRPVKVTPTSAMALRSKIAKTLSSKQLLSMLGNENLKELIIQAQTNTIGSNNKFPNFKSVYALKTIRDRLLKEGNEIVSDTYINSAMMTRIGKDLYHGLGNVLNLITKEQSQRRWEELFPDYRNHAVYIPGHTDGSFFVVKPGLIVSLKPPEFYKDSFPGWEVVHLENQGWHSDVKYHKMKKNQFAPQIKSLTVPTQRRYWIPGEETNEAFHDYITNWMDHWVTYVEETVFDTNMFVIDEHNVICNNENDQVFEAFERHGITPHVINFRHRYFWDGGLHCITSDLHREGTRQDYFPDRTMGNVYTQST